MHCKTMRSVRGAWPEEESMLNDVEVRRNVEHELSCVAQIESPAVVVSVHHGVVTLSGLVHDFVGKIRAGRCATGVAGVAGVLNKIEVALVGQERSNADLARAAVAAVKAQLPSSADAITVAAQDGTLRLEGTLGWNYQRKRAEEAVYALRGVRGVENRIALEHAGPAGEIRWKRRLPSHMNGVIRAVRQNAAAQPVPVRAGGHAAGRKGTLPPLAQGPMPAAQSEQQWPDTGQGIEKHAVSRQTRLLHRLARRLESDDARVRLIVTDISRIMLVGDLAYKFKKALQRDVLDYSTLSARRYACEEELRLNRRLAPELYLGLASITGTRACPAIDGDGPVLEYAVRMRRFDQSALWQERLNAGQLGADEVSALALLLADFHAGAARATPQSPWGNGALIVARTQEDVAGIAAVLDNTRQRAMLDEIAAWLTRQEQALAPLFARRKADGWVRECHGDLHCGNILTLAGQVRIFDGIEFNTALRWIDVAQDLAFAWMDLQCQGRRGLAARLLNDYLERCGDYGSLALLPYYRVQRALVRCKVFLLRSLAGSRGRSAALLQAQRYLAFAHACITPAAPALLIACGLAGSGKSWLSNALVEPLEVVRLRSDVERKRLFAGPAGTGTKALPAQGIYDQAANVATYRRLVRLAQQGLAAGFVMVVDATFLERRRRLALRTLARHSQVPFLLLHVDAPLPVLASRLAARARAGTDPSDADMAVLACQMERWAKQGLRPDEAADVIEIANGADFGAEALASVVAQVRQALQRRAAASEPHLNTT